MYSKRQWRDVPGRTVIDASLILEWRSSGYHDPGQFSGPPERCYPPEGDDVRTVEKAVLEFDDGETVELPRELLSGLEAQFLEEMNDTELPNPD